MSCAFRFRNYAVYVLDERGGPHHRPHAHVKHRGRRIASIFLETLTIFDQSEAMPHELVARIREEQETLVSLWVELNDE
jgi:hypothetical protein